MLFRSIILSPLFHRKHQPHLKLFFRLLRFHRAMIFFQRIADISKAKAHMAFLFLLLRLDAISDLAHPELPDLIQLDEKPAVLPRRLYGIIQKIGKNRGKIDLLDIRKVDVSHPCLH